jgi:anti-sigma regulatory factor (Ser/Thr protein kinase)
MKFFREARGPVSVGDARRFVAAEVAAEGHGELAWTAALLASELATNALVHGGTPFVLRVTGTPAGVRVEVDDNGGGMPVELQIDDMAADRGRGLMMVAAMSRRWGVERRLEDGKTVWFEL